MRRIWFAGIGLMLVLLPFFFLWQGPTVRTRSGYAHHHHYGGGWFFHSYRMGRGDDDYRGSGGGFRGGGPGSRGK